MIKTQAVITSMSSRADKSARLSMSTPELTDDEFSKFRSYQNINCEVTLEPLDFPDVEELRVDKETDTKSPSRRMRDVLYILYKQAGTNEPFDVYYAKKMDALIERLKDKIED